MSAVTINISLSRRSSEQANPASKQCIISLAPKAMQDSPQPPTRYHKTLPQSPHQGRVVERARPSSPSVTKSSSVLRCLRRCILDSRLRRVLRLPDSLRAPRLKASPNTAPDCNAVNKMVKRKHKRSYRNQSFIDVRRYKRGRGGSWGSHVTCCLSCAVCMGALDAELGNHAQMQNGVHNRVAYTNKASTDTGFSISA